MTTTIWTASELIEAAGAEVHGTIGDATGVSIDSRSLAAGELYVAIKGDVHDGHAFVDAAAAAGACASLVSREHPRGEAALLIVDDPLAALERLGRAARARMAGTVVAVTGSVGKTTTKEALRTAFAAAAGPVHASVASFNNHWGVPLTLARMPADTATGIFEIGMNAPGEIAALVPMVRPHVAIITNVAAAHLGAFESIDAIAHAKAEIFGGLEPGGTALLNADDERLPLLLRLATEAGVGRVVTFGEAEGADVRLTRLVEHADCSCISVDVMGEAAMVKVGTPGRHIVQNALAVLGAVKLAGADLATAGLALADLGAVKGRGQRHDVRLDNAGSFLLIDESYNANPASMAAALAMLAQAEPGPRGRRIAALGDMLELGTRSAALHAELAEAVRASADEVHLAGEHMRALAKALRHDMHVVHHADSQALADAMLPTLRDGDVVMAKASLGLRFARVVDTLLAAGEKGATDA